MIFIISCVGGEGPPLDGSAVVNSVHCNDAVDLLPQSGALLVALERTSDIRIRIESHFVLDSNHDDFVSNDLK